jgi:hypothetical protein
VEQVSDDPATTVEVLDGVPRRCDDHASSLPALAFLLAAIWAVATLVSSGYQHRPPTAEEANIGVHLARGEGFRSPMDAAPTAPASAWSAPIYPLVIAGAYRAFGIASFRAVTCLMLINALCFGAIAAALVRLSPWLFRSRTPGVVAAALVALHPLFLFYIGDFWDGLPSLAMFLWLTVAAVGLGRAGERGEPVSGRHVAMLGVGLGLLALTNTSYCTTYPVLCYLAFWRHSAFSRWRLTAVASAAFLVVVTPWTVRNYEMFGQFVFIRTGTGLQFWLGNAPVSNGWLDKDAYALHPYANRDERASLLSLGEPAYNSKAFDRFRQGLVEDPSGFVVRCLRRIAYLLVGNPTQQTPYPLLPNWRWRGILWDSLVVNGALAFLGLAGMVVPSGSGFRGMAMPALAFATGLPFIPTVVMDRYRLPLTCLLVLYASAFLWRLTTRRRAARASSGR